MARSSAWQPVWQLALVVFLTFSPAVQALYFYMDGQSPKCFSEELPKDTLVVGHFTAEAYNEQARSYVLNNDVSIQVTVDEVFDNDHRVVSQRTSASGKFTFSAADAGEHRICFTAFNAPSSGWLLGGAPNQGGVKFKLDMAIGETSQIESTDKEHVNDITSRIRDLNGRLNDIRREQVFQREREAEFRDLSESVNSRVVRWTVIQLVVLGVTCAWQLSYLRAFFIKQKLT